MAYTNNDQSNMNYDFLDNDFTNYESTNYESTNWNELLYDSPQPDPQPLPQSSLPSSTSTQQTSHVSPPQSRTQDFAQESRGTQNKPLQQQISSNTSNGTRITPIFSMPSSASESSDHSSSSNSSTQRKRKSSRSSTPPDMFGQDTFIGGVTVPDPTFQDNKLYDSMSNDYESYNNMTNDTFSGQAIGDLNLGGMGHQTSQAVSFGGTTDFTFSPGSLPTRGKSMANMSTLPGYSIGDSPVSPVVSIVCTFTDHFTS